MPCYISLSFVKQQEAKCCPYKKNNEVWIFAYTNYRHHTLVYKEHLCDIISEWNYKFFKYIVKDNETQFRMDSCIHKANKSINICMNL